MESIRQRNERYSIGNIVDGTVILYGNDACGESSIMYRPVELLCCTPATHGTLCINSTSIKKLQITK